MISLFIANRVPTFDISEKCEVYFANYSISTGIKEVDKKDFKFLFGVKGESYTIDANDFCLEEFLSKMQARIMFSEQLSDVVCYYGYSPKIKYLQMVDGEIVNIHIAVRKSCVKVGTPIIYGSF